VNERRILFEASLAKTGGRLVWIILVVTILLVGFGLYFTFGVGPFPYSAIWLLWVGAGVFALV